MNEFVQEMYTRFNRTHGTTIDDLELHATQRLVHQLGMRRHTRNAEGCE